MQPSLLAPATLSLVITYRAPWSTLENLQYVPALLSYSIGNWSTRDKCLAHCHKTNRIVLTPHSFHCGCYSGKELFSKENWKVFSFSQFSRGRQGGGWWQNSKGWLEWAVCGQCLKQTRRISSVPEVTPFVVVVKARGERTREPSESGMRGGVSKGWD